MRPAKILLLAVILSASALCIPTKRDVTGTVRDQNGNPLPGAVVQLENMLTMQVRSYITPLSGRYYFTNVYSLQDYHLRAHYRRRWSKSRDLNEFNEANPAILNLIVRLPEE